MQFFTKEFTVREVVEAIKENGVDHLRNDWFQTHGGKLTGGCVLGQGAFNLGVLPFEDWRDGGLEELIGEWDEEEENFILKYDIEGEYNLVEQLDKFDNLHPKWSSGIDAAKEGYHISALELHLAGSAIIAWNDLSRLGSPKKYYLKTYEEVAQMVADILEPYLDEKITLQTIDYSEWKAPVLSEV